MPKVYISGAISGLPIAEAIEKFQYAENMLSSINFEVFNPIKISPFDPGKSWADYMRDDLSVLLDFGQEDCIFMLKGYENSRGARIELAVAKELGVTVIYQSKQG